MQILNSLLKNNNERVTHQKRNRAKRVEALDVRKFSGAITQINHPREINTCLSLEI
jgi:hypothetical protein